MLTFIAGFLKTHWLGALAGTMVIGVVTTVSLERMEIAHLKRQVAQYEAENITLANANKALTVSVENQNAAVLALQADADAKSRKASAALAAAQADVQKYAAMAKRLRSQYSSEDTCSDARAIVDEYIEDMK